MRCDILRDPCPPRSQTGGASCTYLSLPLPLPGLSLPRPSGLSRPPARPLCALPSRLSGRPGGSARWVPEESLPAPEPATRDGEGWLLGGLAASAAPRPGPDAATAVLVWVSSAIRPRAVPMRAPTSAPTTTRSWPRRRNDRSTGPPKIEHTTLTTLPQPAEPNPGSLISSCSLTTSPRGRSSVWWRRRRAGRHGPHQPESRQGGMPATAWAGRQPRGGGTTSSL